MKVCYSDPRTVTVKAVVHLKMKACHYLLHLMSFIQTYMTFFYWNTEGDLFYLFFSEEYPGHSLQYNEGIEA